MPEQNNTIEHIPIETIFQKTKPIPSHRDNGLMADIFCPDCGMALIRLGACFTCPICGFGSCG